MAITALPAWSGCRIWHVDLGAAPAASAVASLSEAEWERARRFVFSRDRQRFVAAHAALRDILSAQTGVAAAMLEFAVGPFGKPGLVEPAGVQFNLSHSQSMALIAVHPGTDVGVDIESSRPMPDAQTLAASYFSDAEVRALSRVAASERDATFLTCWTRKEACLKALGLGLSVDTRSVEVGVLPVACEVRVAGERGPVRLSLASLSGVDGAACAIARVLAHDEGIHEPARRLMAESESSP